MPVWLHREKVFTISAVTKLDEDIMEVKICTTDIEMYNLCDLRHTSAQHSAYEPQHFLIYFRSGIVLVDCMSTDFVRSLVRS